MKVIIIYTMPWGEHCSMRWLHEELSKKYDCEIVAPSEDWCLFGDESAKGKIARNVWFFGLAVRAVCKAKPGDIIVSSPRNIGLFTLALARGGSQSSLWAGIRLLEVSFSIDVPARHLSATIFGQA